MQIILIKRTDLYIRIKLKNDIFKMKAAIFFTGKFGSTKKYAYWINERNDFPVFDLNKENPNPDDYDLLILGSSIIAMKPTIRKWLLRNWPIIKDKQILLYTVSGTEPGHPDLQLWLNQSLSKEILEHLHYVPLRGRLALNELPWIMRIFLKIASKVEKDPDIRKRMAEGFDYMEKNSIEPIFEWIANQEGRFTDNTIKRQLQFA